MQQDPYFIHQIKKQMTKINQRYHKNVIVSQIPNPDINGQFKDIQCSVSQKGYIFGLYTMMH